MSNLLALRGSDGFGTLEHATRGNVTFRTVSRSPVVEELPPPLLKPSEVAGVLNVTVSQVYTLMRSGELPALKIGRKGVWRVSREALEAYLVERTEEARARAR
jgi:excisionase family DNA binding protein